MKQLQWSNVKQTFSSMFRMGSTKDNGGENTNSDPSLGAVEITDFLEVKKGMHTEVSLKARAGNKSLDPLCFLSIVAVNRTIDIQCSTSKDRDLFYRSLQGIVTTNKLRVRFS